MVRLVCRMFCVVLLFQDRFTGYSVVFVGLLCDCKALLSGMCVLLHTMKVVFLATVCVAMVAAQTPVSPTPVTRNLPADVLRDFPGACFASTACRVFQVGESWPLAPFCGKATCLLEGTQYTEKVEDCGLRPKESPGCELVNEADLTKEFPTCCPKYNCQAGSELLYPTPEELEAEAKAQAAAAAAAAAQAKAGAVSASA